MREFEITQEMIEAGAKAIHEWSVSDDFFDAGALYILRAVLSAGGFQISKKDLQIPDNSLKGTEGYSPAVPF